MRRIAHLILAIDATLILVALLAAAIDFHPHQGQILAFSMFHFVGLLWDMQDQGYWLTLVIGMVVVIGCDLLLYTAKPGAWLLATFLRIFWAIILVLNLLLTGSGGFFNDPIIATATAAELVVILGVAYLVIRGFRHVNAATLARRRLPPAPPSLTNQDDVQVPPGWDEGGTKSKPPSQP